MCCAVHTDRSRKPCVCVQHSSTGDGEVSCRVVSLVQTEGTLPHTSTRRGKCCGEGGKEHTTQPCVEVGDGPLTLPYARHSSVISAHSSQLAAQSHTRHGGVDVHLGVSGDLAVAAVLVARVVGLRPRLGGGPVAGRRLEAQVLAAPPGHAEVPHLAPVLAPRVAHNPVGGTGSPHPTRRRTRCGPHHRSVADA